MLFKITVIAMEYAGYGVYKSARASRERFENSENVRYSLSPYLIIHGKADALIPYQHS
jgi:hypothetical protein